MSTPVEFIRIFIDGQEVFVSQQATVFQACEQAGVVLPRFCYEDRLSVAGNCRMCLVEIEKSPKPQVSCAFPVIEGIKVFTKTPLVKKARESVLEFLLLNHPLDCPICDQGGECDLQEQTMVFGSDRGRFHEGKRGVENKDLGPFIKTIITRCIHCTRCVRFAQDIGGIDSLGTTNRGISTEIGTYINKGLDIEWSGNFADLCPVGALTAKVYAFQARPWELESWSNFDPHESCALDVSVQTKSSTVLRVLPSIKTPGESLWLTDKTRYAFDGISLMRVGNVSYNQ